MKSSSHYQITIAVTLYGSLVCAQNNPEQVALCTEEATAFIKGKDHSTPSATTALRCWSGNQFH